MFSQDVDAIHHKHTRRILYLPSSRCWPPKKEIEGPKQKYGGLGVGTLSDDFATFCEAVDMHLTSLGEPSRLILEGSFAVVEKTMDPDEDDTIFLLGSGR